MKRANNIKLNIGLKNNPFNSNEILDKLFNTGLICELLHFDVVTGRYKNEAENTLVVEAITKQNLVFCVDMVQRLCSVLTQDCIASIIDNNDLLIYQIGYKGEKQKFNKDYFINY